MTYNYNTEEVFRLLDERGLTLASAESCTGGLFAGEFTGISGASRVFVGGAVTYTDRLKTVLLGVSPELLRTKGAVSAEVAAQMAEGAAKHLGADIGVSVTGLAGPDGDGSDTPVGTVYIGIYAYGASEVEKFVFESDRAGVRRLAVENMFAVILKKLTK